MANEIDLIIGNEAFAQISKLLSELNKVDASFTELSTKFASLGNNTTTIKSTADLAKLTAENAKLNTIIEQQIKDYSDLNEKLKEGISLSQTKGKYTTQETTDLRLVNKELTLQNTKASELAGAYEKLSAAHKIARESAANLGVVQGINSKAFLEASASANTLDKKLKEIDQQLGQHGRHVGDYSRSWNGLGNSINQITREAPAFANSIQTGFMALSNNIPILADEINNLTLKNKELQATGKPVESIFKTVAGAFFSWQTLLSIGVTLLTIYGAKLWALATAGDAVSKSQKALSDANAEGAKNANEEIYKLDVLYRTSQNNTLSIEERTKAVDKMQKLYPSYFANLSDEEILIGKGKDSYIQLKDAIIASSRAKAISGEMDKLAAEEFANEMEIRVKIEEKMIEASKRKKTLTEVERTPNISPAQVARAKAMYQSSLDDIREYNKQVGALQNGLIKQSDIFLKARMMNEDKAAKLEADRAGKGLGKQKEDKSAEEFAKKEEERLKKNYETLLSNLNRQKEIDKDAMDLFRGGIQEKSMLSAKLAVDEIAIANAVFNEKVRLAKGDVDLVKQAENTKKTEIENAGQENIKRISGFYSNLFKTANDSIPKNIFGDKYKMTDEQKKDLKEHEDLVKKTADEMKNYLSSFGTEFASKAGFSETFDMLSGNIAGFGTDAKVTFVAIAESAQEMFGMISELSQANFDQEYARLEKQKESSLRFAGDSAINKERIEADYTKKKHEIEVKEFKQKQKITLANIAIDTAQAIVSTWAQVPKFDFGISATALSIMIGAMGAVQAGMVLSQKPPAYAEGTDNHTGGLMLVNDGAGNNYQEKIVLPNGKVIRPQGRNVLMNAPKGTKVLNHEQQLFEMLQNNNISMDAQQSSGMTPSEMDEILGKHFSGIKTQNTIFDKNGFQSYIKNGNSITRSNSNRSQSIGISV